jgi:hypothetical protein
MYEDMDTQRRAFQSLALDGGELSDWRPDLFMIEEASSVISWTENWEGPKVKVKVRLPVPLTTEL